MRWILVGIMPLVQDQWLKLLTYSSACYHCTTAAPCAINPNQFLTQSMTTSYILQDRNFFKSHDHWINGNIYPKPGDANHKNSKHISLKSPMPLCQYIGRSIWPTTWPISSDADQTIRMDDCLEKSYLITNPWPHSVLVTGHCILTT